MSQAPMPQENVHVNRMIVRIPNPDKFFEVFTARHTRVSVRELQDLTRQDIMIREMGVIGDRINSILTMLLSDMDTPPAIVLHPDFGRPIVYDRIVRLFGKARLVLEGELKNVKDDIRNKNSAEEVKRAVYEFLVNIKTVYLALREGLARLLIIYYSNLPSDMRPPTANIILGFDPYAPKGG